MLSLLKHSISIQVTIDMEKTILDLLDTGSPLTVIKFLQDLEILETNKQCPSNEVYRGSTKIGPMWICLQEQTFQKYINLFPPKAILINLYLCKLWKIMKIQL